MKQFAGSFVSVFLCIRSHDLGPKHGLRPVISTTFFLSPARAGIGSFDNRNEPDWRRRALSCKCAEHLEAQANLSLPLCTKRRQCETTPRLSEGSPQYRPPAFAGWIHGRDMLCQLQSSPGARPAPAAPYFLEAG